MLNFEAGYDHVRIYSQDKYVGEFKGKDLFWLALSCLKVYKQNV